MLLFLLGPRLHMRSTGEITNFSLHKELVYDERYPGSLPYRIDRRYT